MRGRLLAAAVLIAAASSFAQDRAPEHDLDVYLRREAFQAPTAARTLENIEKFLAETGDRAFVKEIYDGCSTHYDMIRLSHPASGAWDSMWFNIKEGRFERLLRSRPEVAQVITLQADGSVTGIDLLFRQPMYLDELLKFRASLAAIPGLPFEFDHPDLQKPVNGNMFVVMDVAKMTNPQAVADQLAKRWPQQVMLADVSTWTEVFRVDIGTSR